MRTIRPLLLCLLLATVIASLTAAAPPKARVSAGRHGAVAADHLLASHAGVAILQAGGNALDAAIATAFALGVVNPASSGLGGGGMLVYWSAAQRRAYALDFRETAPAAISPASFVRDGKPDTRLSQEGGLAVAVPAEVAGLVEASRRLGRLPFARLVTPAAALARRGFLVGPELAGDLEEEGARVRQWPALASLYMPGGRALAEGRWFRNPELAATLESIGADQGRDFYRGRLARRIVEAVRSAGGVMTEADLAGYRPVWRQPLRGVHRGCELFTMPPPSSGGAILLEMLHCLELLPVPWGEPDSSRTLHYLAEVEKHAFADRARYFGDPAFVRVPLAMLLSPAHARRIVSLIDAAQASAPEACVHELPADGGTTHVSTVDADGNACALTSTINTGFGSLLAVPGTGMVLNDEMDDFAIAPGVANAFGLVAYEANAPAPGKRPLSSMTPTIAVRDGLPVLVVGSSGGPRIITGTLRVLTCVLDGGLDVGAAIDAARVHHQWQPDLLRLDESVPAADVDRLRRMGHHLETSSTYNAVQAIVAGPDGLRAASDPRKSGQAAAY